MTTPALLRTERLVLRCWSADDAPRLRESLDLSDAHLRPWIPFMKDEPRSLEDTVSWLEGLRSKFRSGEDFRYAILSPDGDTLLGETMLLTRAGPGAREIGYWIDVRHTGRGYATEASAAMVRVAFEFDAVERLEVHCDVANAPSLAVPRKLGFTRSPTPRLVDGGVELAVWTLAVDEYGQSPARNVALEAFDEESAPLRMPPPEPSA